MYIAEQLKKARRLLKELNEVYSGMFTDGLEDFTNVTDARQQYLHHARFTTVTKWLMEED
jgi:hypothetical protein